LTFSPTAQLKAVISEITGKDVVTFEDLEKLPKVEEFEWRPFHNAWLDVSRDHIWAWTNDPRRIEYAKNDVEYLRILYDYFKQPKSDNDSRLAWGIGQMFGHGYAINIGKVEDRLSYIDSKLCDLDINVNAPRQMLKLLHDNCLPIERPFIKDTRSDTLKNIIKNDLSCKHVAEKILNARHDLKEKDLLNKIKLVKRLHPMYKAVGTKSNRMSGGSENYIKSSGSINVQGIKKGDSIRSLFKLADEGYILCGGDFDAFEVSIADAVYDDEQLRTDLLSGKKIHGLFAEEIYGIPYDEIYLHKDENENDPKGWYGRGKKAVFAFFYGANYQKIASVMGISEEEAQKGLINLKRRYPGIERAQVRAFDNLSALRQPDGIGTKVIWKDPKMFAESLLGFRRDFTLEFNIIKSIFNLSNKLSKDFGKEFTVVRRDRMQTGGGAARSALYAAAFNLQSYVIRAGINHEIQSTGGEITKEVQGAIWEVQPIGISQFLVLPLNMHDEIMCPCKPEVVGMVEKIVYREINRLKSIVPLLGMKWKSNLDSWSNK
jgi:DNA polymerase I-like protein with 3'-5' exonuclease and polymerase domains